MCQTAERARLGLQGRNVSPSSEGCVLLLGFDDDEEEEGSDAVDHEREGTRATSVERCKGIQNSKQTVSQQSSAHFFSLTHLSALASCCSICSTRPACLPCPPAASTLPSQLRLLLPRHPPTQQGVLAHRCRRKSQRRARCRPSERATGLRRGRRGSLMLGARRRWRILDATLRLP